MFIHRDVLRAIVDHATRDAPDECCGLLLGQQETIDEAAETANLRRSPTAYLIDPAAHIAALRRARTSGRTILAAYHSHPRSAPVPSPTDVAEARDAALVHVIVSLVSPVPEIRGYLIANGNFTEVPLVTVPEPASSGC